MSTTEIPQAPGTKPLDPFVHEALEEAGVLEQTIEKALRRDMVRRMITDAHGRLLDIRSAVFLYTTGGLYTAVNPKTWNGLSADGKLEMHANGVRLAIGIDGAVQAITSYDEQLAQPLLGRRVRTQHGVIDYIIESIDDAGWTLRAEYGEKGTRFIPNEKTGTLVFK